MTDSTYSIDDLCRMTGFTRRTIRFYIQEGLVARPEGERRGAYYLNTHLETLLTIKRLTAAGLSLDAVRARLETPDEAEPPVRRRPGSTRTCVHVTVADGVELVIDPTEAGLAPEKLRALTIGIGELIERLTAETQDSAAEKSNG